MKYFLIFGAIAVVLYLWGRLEMWLDGRNEATCGHCGWEGSQKQLHEFSDGGAWVKACPECNREKIILISEAEFY